VHPYWVQLTGGKSLLLVNGATTSGMTVWQENLATVAGQTYDFSASAADVCCNSAHPGNYAPSELEFQVSSNGFATFQTLATITTNPAADAGQFDTVTDTFTATGPLQVRVIDVLTGRVGNDFALSDISVTAAPGSGALPDQPGPGGVSAVPEPASWALMLTAMAGLGVAMRSGRAARAVGRHAARNRAIVRPGERGANASIRYSPAGRLPLS